MVRRPCAYPCARGEARLPPARKTRPSRYQTTPRFLVARFAARGRTRERFKGRRPRVLLAHPATLTPSPQRTSSRPFMLASPRRAGRLASFASLVLALAAATTTSCASESPTPAEPTLAEAPRPAPSPAPPPSPVDAPPPALSPDEVTVAVSHDREIRGAWVSTVHNGTWPSRTGLSQQAAKSELLALFDALAAAHMNAVFLQVRPESDALYASILEPWSRFLTGTQGQSPGWDPLAFAVAEAHTRGLELHAWVNPYRGMTSTSVVTAANHVTRMLPDRAYPYGAQLWMDPGAPEVRAHIIDVVRDIVTRYDVDGLHFDDYFYPYPVAGTPFPDDVTYDAYVTGGGALDRNDWRRSNVNTLVREVSELVAQVRPDVRFGISPFGIHRPGMPAGITGLDAFAELYCDAPRWMNEGWVDYVAPQLYWPTTRTAQAFGKLVTWWAGLAQNGRSVIIGHDLTRIGTPEWPLSEISQQVKLSRDERPKGVRGNLFFTAKALATDQLGVRTELASTYWSVNAATPLLATAGNATLATPVVTAAGNTVQLAAPAPAPAPAPAVRLRAWAIHRRIGIRWKLAELVMAKPGIPTATLSLPPGDYAISAIDRRGVESAGALLTVP